MRRSFGGAAAAACLLVMPAVAEATIVAPPDGARVIDFDDVPAPALFIDATALRDRYAPLGVRFSGAEPLDGGAVLNDSSFAGIVSGYSPPNVFGFNENELADGGVASLPGTIEFRKPVSYVQINVTNPSGASVTMQAYAADGNLIEDATVTPEVAVMTTLALSEPGIVRVVISSDAPSLITDDLAFVLDQTRIDFEDLDPAPNVFDVTQALRDRYADLGVRFEGDGNDGGAILTHEFFTFDARSGTNFLAFFNDSVFEYTDGGRPRFPERLLFDPPVRVVEFYFASNGAATLLATAFNADDEILSSTMIESGPTMTPVVLEADAIASVLITTTGSVEAIDDLSFEASGTVIDFDDLLPAPGAFADAEPLGDRYLPLGIEFRGDMDNGGAVLDQLAAGFNISGFSPPNVLAFAMGGEFGSGGRAKFPETLLFDPPIRRLEFRVGFALESTITAEAFDATGTSLGSEMVNTTIDLKKLSLVAPGAVEVRITSNGSSAFFDDFLFTQVDPCAHDLCVIGAKLDKTCDACATKVCAADSLCCSDGWDDLCRLEVTSICGLECPACAHDFCVSGGPLDPRCGGCAALVCAQDAYCCDVEWDAACVEAVPEICGGTCTPPCEHSICSAGAALDPECSPCVASVCQTKPSCCSGAWTTECMLATLASMECPGGCDVCGDANRDGKILSGDALQVLRAAVGNGSCPVERCDYNDDGKVLSGDALAVLRAAVGQPTNPQCPSV